jgi:hypothetical protein
MFWGDERYVRIYTRDTTDLLAMGWEARAVLWEILRKADRSGCIRMGKHGVRGLAVLIHMPPEVVERALPVLLADGCVRANEDELVIPNFLAAQEAPKSDAERKRLERERKRERAMAALENKGESRKRDTSHEMSLRAVPSSPVPNHPSLSPAADDSSTAEEPPAQPVSSGGRGCGSEDVPSVEMLWDFYARQHAKKTERAATAPALQMTKKDRATLVEALSAGRTPEELAKAIIGRLFHEERENLRKCIALALCLVDIDGNAERADANDAIIEVQDGKMVHLTRWDVARRKRAEAMAREESRDAAERGSSSRTRRAPNWTSSRNGTARGPRPWSHVPPVFENRPRPTGDHNC